MRRRRGREGGARGPRRIFWRVYLFGLLLLVAVTVTIGVTAGLLSQPRPREETARRIARYTNDELSPLLDDRGALQEKVARIRDAFRVDVVVYDASGQALAQAGPDPLPFPSEPPAEPSLESRRGTHVAVIPLDEGRAYAVGRYRWRGPQGSAWLLVPLSVLLVLAGVAALVTRSLVRPIERVTTAARAVGEGELSARTGVRRRDEVGDLARAFDDMAERLQRLVEAEQELLANVSHELRTPLARVRVALELAEDDDPEGARARLRGMGQDLAELDQIVEQVLLTSRLERAEGMPVEREAVDVSELVRSAADRFDIVHGAHRLIVGIEGQEAPAADGKLLRRVIDNLLDNAAKYTDPEAGPIELEITQRAHALSVAVHDRGIGVGEDDLPLLFEPFFRTDRSRARGSGGTGLGLALCRRIIEAHGGRIQAQERVGGGLTVQLTIPA